MAIIGSLLAILMRVAQVLLILIVMRLVLALDIDPMVLLSVWFAMYNSYKKTHRNDRHNSMRTIMNKLRLLPLAAALMVATACDKTVIKEEIQFPTRVELIVGQYCLPHIILEENETTRTISDWVSSNQDVAMIKGDTIFALAQGTTEMTAKYQDNFGEHSISCSVTVADLEIPTAEDTVFVQYGDDIELCKFNIPGSYPISYVLEKGDGTADYATLATEELPYETSSLIQFSPVYTYSLRKIVPEQGFTSLRLICEPLGMDVTMPIVTLPSNEGENRNTNL